MARSSFLVVYCEEGLKPKLMMGRQAYVALDVTTEVETAWKRDGNESKRPYYPRRDLHITVLYDHYNGRYGVEHLKKAVGVLAEKLMNVEFSFQLRSEVAWSSCQGAMVCNCDYLLRTIADIQSRREYSWYYPHDEYYPHVTFWRGWHSSCSAMVDTEVFMQRLGRPSVDAAALQSIWAEQVFAKLAAEEMFAEEMRRRWPAATAQPRPVT